MANDRAVTTNTTAAQPPRARFHNLPDDNPSESFDVNGDGNNDQSYFRQGGDVIRVEGRLTENDPAKLKFGQEVELTMIPFTTDADVVLDPARLGPIPPLGQAMEGAGFTLTDEPASGRHDSPDRVSRTRSSCPSI